MPPWFLCALLLFAVSTRADPPSFRVFTPDPRDEVSLCISDGLLMLDIQSHDGIGRLRLEPLGPSWPDEIRIHLNVTELEGCSLTFEGGRKLEASRRHPGPLSIARDQQGMVVRIPSEALPPAEVRQMEFQWIDYYR